MTINKLIAALERARQNSPQGGQTVVMIQDMHGLVDVNRVEHAPPQSGSISDGAVVVLSPSIEED
jgi:hypothetical protein